MKRKILNLLKKFAPLAVFLGISLAIHLIAYKGQWGQLINGGDIDYPINIGLEIKRSLYVWSGEALGVPEFFAVSKLFLLLPQLIIQMLVRSITLTNFLYFTVLRAFAGIFMFMLLRYLKFGKLAMWVGSLFFMLNVYVFLRFQFPQPHLLYAYASLPLLVYILARTFDKTINPYLGAGIFALVMMSISRTANIYLIYWILVPAIVLVLGKMDLISIRIRLREVCLIVIVALFLNTVVFLSYFGSRLNYSDIAQNSLLEYYRNDATLFSKDYKLVETMAGFGSYAWTHGLSSINPGDHNFPILGNISKSAMLTLGLVPIICMIISGLINLKKRWVLLFIFIIFGILANGFGSPFGSIFAETLSKIPLYSDLFRDSWTYWSMPYFFIGSLLLALLFNQKLEIKQLFKFTSEKFVYTFTRVQIVFFLFIFGILLYVIPGRAINEAWISPITYGYLEMAEYLNENAKGQKVLPLPLSKHIYGYTYYDWGYAGPDIMHRLADVDYIDGYYNQIQGNKTVSILNSLQEPNATTLNDFLFRTQTNWILLRNDFIDLPGDGSKVRLNEFKALISNFDCWNLVSEYGQLSLYRNTCNDHSKDSIQVSSKIIYGSNECRVGLPVDKYFPNSSICGKEPKNNGFSIVGDSLYINNEDESQSLDLKSGHYDLISNYNFNNGVWNNGSRYTCDPEDTEPSEIQITKLKKSSGIRITSAGQRTCMFEPVMNSNIGKGGILKVTYSNNSTQSIRYCIFGLKDNFCYFSGVLGEDSQSDGIITRREESFGYVTDYVYLKNIDRYKDKNDMSLYLYLNDEKEKIFSIDIKEVRFVTLPLSYSGQVVDGINLDRGKNLDLTIKNYVWGSQVSWSKDAVGNYVVSLNQNKNAQWRLIGIRNNKTVTDLSSQELTTYDYANGWYVKNIESYDSLIIVYIPQIIYMIGLFATLWIYLVYLAFWIWGLVFKR